MAEASVDPTTWMLLSEALRLVAIYTHSTPAGKELLLHGLREAYIRWWYWKKEGHWGPSEEVEAASEHYVRLDDPRRTQRYYRWSWFWRSSLRPGGRCLAIDWESSSAHCTGDDPAWAPALPLPTDYRLSLIRLCREDVEALLQAQGLMPSSEAEAASPRRAAPEPSSSAPVEPSRAFLAEDPNPRNAPGRPSPRSLIEAEAKRRLDQVTESSSAPAPTPARAPTSRVQVEPRKLMEFARSLEAWLKEEHPSVRSIKAKRIAEQIRPLWNAALDKTKSENQPLE